MPDNRGRLVWDSDRGRIDPRTRDPNEPPPGDGIVRVRREVGGRGGKTVTTVAGIRARAPELKAIAKDLKRLCGVGGAVKDFVIEIQGDQRDRVVPWLEARGYTVKLAGG